MQFAAVVARLGVWVFAELHLRQLRPSVIVFEGVVLPSQSQA